MEYVKSFAAIVDARTRVLILGSMPGSASLSAGHYYAHPRNRFWPLMERLAGVPLLAGYEARLDAILRAGIGLWDAIAECRRVGSLDASIVSASVRSNDLLGLLDDFPAISRICCNGSSAYGLARRILGKRLSSGAARRLDLRLLPSTSPANASYGFDALLDAWGKGLAEEP